MLVVFATIAETTADPNFLKFKSDVTEFLGAFRHLISDAGPVEVGGDGYIRFPVEIEDGFPRYRLEIGRVELSGPSSYFVLIEDLPEPDELIYDSDVRAAT